MNTERRCSRQTVCLAEWEDRELPHYARNDIVTTSDVEEVATVSNEVN